MGDLLPVGTIVRVTPLPIFDQRPYTAIVRGYDMGHTKYHLSPEYLLGEFTEEGLSWAFPKEVAPVLESPVLRELIRRSCAESDGFDFDRLEAHDYQSHASRLLAALAPYLTVPEKGES